MKHFEQMLTQSNARMGVADRKERGPLNGIEEEKVLTPTTEAVFKVIKILKMNKDSGPD